MYRYTLSFFIVGCSLVPDYISGNNKRQLVSWVKRQAPLLLRPCNSLQWELYDNKFSFASPVSTGTCFLSRDEVLICA